MAKGAKVASEYKQIIEVLNEIFQNEMAGIIRYLHYSFMIMGHNRIPIQAWFRAQANESMTHSVTIGEKITSLGGHPPVVSAKVEESNVHDVNRILKESLVHEEHTLSLYKKLSKMAVEVDDVALEELGREMVRLETEHVDEVRKMLQS
jgi:bacterioferritin